MNREAYVYILAGNKPQDGHPPIYVGSTTDLVQRVALHRDGQGSRHTARYRIRRLVWYEVHDSIDSAQARERRIKRWERAWKDELIEEFNPEWRDLYRELA
ncbi:MAG: GIY-YIG nuclease family protein [Chloroflexota bacterium]|nr:GIY-YIG nuclease family protein [Chloroflexota bacterium]MDE2894787.1 GIY-YIG nuclease family protein [Chloroflexota bacterium]